MADNTVDTDEIYERTRNYWNTSLDVIDVWVKKHMAIPEMNAVVYHVEDLIEEEVNASHALKPLIGSAASAHFRDEQRRILIGLFMTAYLMGKSGDDLIQVPATCDHDHDE